MNKFLVYSVTLLAGLSLGLLNAADEDKKGGKGGKGGKVDPGKRAEMMLKNLDKDDSGTISKEEFAASPKLKDKGDMVDKIFAARDKDGDGELSKKELSAPMGGGKGKGDKGGKGKGDKGDKGGKGGKGGDAE